MMNHYCKVNYCRYADKHTTFGHRCGKCGGYGHGQMECGNAELLKYLRNYKNEILPKLLRCQVSECKYPKYHTSDSHPCSLCDGMGHQCVNIECPICLIKNNFKEVPKKVFGISDICGICKTNSIEIIFPKCSHAVCCLECFNEMAKIKLRTLSPLHNVNNNPNNTGPFGFDPKGKAENSFGNKDGKIYTYVGVGMGCSIYYRRKSINHPIEEFFMHNDDWGQYGPKADKRKDLEDFWNGYEYTPTIMN